MAALRAEPHFTPAEYLARERAAEIKSEYIDGAIVATSGAGRNHSRITGNIARVLGNQVVDRECEVYSADMRVRAAIRRPAYLYPDVVMTCGEQQLEDEMLDTLLNPTVIVEVLSPSTERYDRGKTFMYYRAIESLQEYLLIARTPCRSNTTSGRARVGCCRNGTGWPIR